MPDAKKATDVAFLIMPWACGRRWLQAAGMLSLPGSMVAGLRVLCAVRCGRLHSFQGRQQMDAAAFDHALGMQTPVAAGSCKADAAWQHGGRA